MTMDRFIQGLKNGMGMQYPKWIDSHKKRSDYIKKVVKEISKGSKEYKSLTLFKRMVFRFNCNCNNRIKIDRDDLSIKENGFTKYRIETTHCVYCGRQCSETISRRE